MLTNGQRGEIFLLLSDDFHNGPFSELLYGAYSGSEKYIAKGIEGLLATFRA